LGLQSLEGRGPHKGVKNHPFKIWGSFKGSSIKEAHPKGIISLGEEVNPPQAKHLVNNKCKTLLREEPWLEMAWKNVRNSK